MSDLQIALIAIGILIILAVVIINWWQEKRFHRQLDRELSPTQQDVLLEDASVTDNKAALNAQEIDAHATDHFYINTEALEDSVSEPTMVPQSSTFSDSQDEVFPPEIAEPALIEPSVLHQTKPALTEKEANNIAADSDLSTDVTTEANDVATEPSVETLKEAGTSLPAMLQTQMDLTALLYLASATSAHAINQALGVLFNGFDKPVFIHVLDANKQWHLLEELSPNSDVSNSQISRVACSIQLADRAGAISRSTLNRFELNVENFSLAINSHIQWQAKEDAFANAIILDEFCIQVDKTIGFHLTHGENGAFTGTKLRGIAEAQGLLLGADGNFNCIEEPDTIQAHPSFVMFNRDDYPFNPEMLRTSVVKSITFQLDIPHVKKCAEAFNRMVQIARQMELSLNAVLVDDNNMLLGDVQIEKIRQQLKVIQANMLLRGIVPGSESARRLFS